MGNEQEEPGQAANQACGCAFHDCPNNQTSGSNLCEACKISHRTEVAPGPLPPEGEPVPLDVHEDPVTGEPLVTPAPAVPAKVPLKEAIAYTCCNGVNGDHEVFCTSLSAEVLRALQQPSRLAMQRAGAPVVRKVAALEAQLAEMRERAEKAEATVEQLQVQSDKWEKLAMKHQASLFDVNATLSTLMRSGDEELRRLEAEIEQLREKLEEAGANNASAVRQTAAVEREAKRLVAAARRQGWADGAKAMRATAVTVAWDWTKDPDAARICRAVADRIRALPLPLPPDEPHAGEQTICPSFDYDIGEHPGICKHCRRTDAEHGKGTVAVAAGSTGRWRVGRRVGRTLYLDDVLVGTLDTPELAAQAVAALNGASVAPIEEKPVRHSPSSAILLLREQGADAAAVNELERCIDYMDNVQAELTAKLQDEKDRCAAWVKFKAGNEGMSFGDLVRRIMRGTPAPGVAGGHLAGASNANQPEIVAGAGAGLSIGRTLALDVYGLCVASDKHDDLAGRVKTREQVGALIDDAIAAAVDAANHRAAREVLQWVRGDESRPSYGKTAEEMFDYLRAGCPAPGTVK